LSNQYAIAGRVLSVHTSDEWSAQTVSWLVDGWNLRPIENTSITPDAIIRISSGITPPQIPAGLTNFDISDGAVCHSDATTSYLDFHGSLVVINASNDVTVWICEPLRLDLEVLARILSQAFSAAWRRCGLFEFHSGGVVPPQERDALLIAGESGSGKSTITASLAVSGWSYLSDDTLLLKAGSSGVEVFALRQFFALTATTVAALPITTRPRVNGGEKERFAPHEFFPSQQIDSAKPRVVLFPVITGESDSQLRKLTASDTMSRLLKLCPWSCYDNVSAGDHLKVLGQLAQKVEGFDILAGTDLLQDSGRAADLAYQAYSRN
jgi:hypothetical protein